MQLEPYNSILLVGFLVAVLLNFKESTMMYLSFAGLLLLGVISPSLEPLDNPIAIYGAAALELLAALLFSFIAFISRGRNALSAGYSMATFSFFNLSAHFGAVYMLSNYGRVSELYDMQLRVGECLQLLTVILFSLPVQMLGASIRQKYVANKRGSSTRRERGNGRRSLGAAWR